jgi:zinc transport system substrate-binding protein
MLTHRRPVPGSRRRSMILAAATVAATLASTGCGGNATTKTTGAPFVTVVTTVWPLAEAAKVIGMGNVRVDDVVPAGSDPDGYVLGATARAEVHRAGLAIEVGAGWDTSLESVVAHTHIVHIQPSGSDPYVWLNPHDMEAVARQIAGALKRADPKAASTFGDGLDNFEAQLSSLDADYQSTLSVCPDQDLVTVNDAFAALHPYYPVVDKPIAPGGAVNAPPSKAMVAKEVRIIRSAAVKEIYTETWIPQSYIIEATVTTRVKIGTLNTLAGPPQSGWPISADGSKYVSLMEQNLGVMSSALHCPNPDSD